MQSEYRNGVGYKTAEEADDLEEYAYDRHDRFVRWHPWGNEPDYDSDVWVVIGRSWKWTVSWIRDRDSIPTWEDHRIYTLMNRNFEEIEVSERDLNSGEWRNLAPTENLGKERGRDD